MMKPKEKPKEKPKSKVSKDPYPKLTKSEVKRQARAKFDAARAKLKRAAKKREAAVVAAQKSPLQVIIDRVAAEVEAKKKLRQVEKAVEDAEKQAKQAAASRSPEAEARANAVLDDSLEGLNAARLAVGKGPLRGFEAPRPRRIIAANNPDEPEVYFDAAGNVYLAPLKTMGGLGDGGGDFE